MTRLLLTTAALVAIAMTGAANAADLPLPPPVYRAPPPPLVYNWTGCYVGAGYGYGLWTEDANFDGKRRRVGRTTQTDHQLAAGAGSARAKSAAIISLVFRSAPSGAPMSLSAPSPTTNMPATTALRGTLTFRARWPWRRKHAMDMGGRRPRRLPGDAEIPDLFRRRLHPGKLQSGEFPKSRQRRASRR